MSIFEAIPQWAHMQSQQQQQQPQFNPAPQIMSQYRGGVSGAMPPMMPMPNPTASQPQDMGTQMQGLLGNPNSSNNPVASSMGSGGLIQLLAAMQNGRNTGASGTGLPSMIDNQMPGGAPSEIAGGGGGIFSILKSLFQ